MNKFGRFRKLISLFVRKFTPLKIYWFVESRFRPVRNFDGLLFDVSSRIPYFRAREFVRKERDLEKLIKKYYRPQDVFFDVGANIGVFSLFAAQRQLRVFSFEPEAENFNILNRNIYLNGACEDISAYCCCVGGYNQASQLLVSSARTPGKSLNSFVRPDESGLMHGFKYSQGSLVVSIDELTSKFGLPIPNHIKIDVDGNEDLVVDGMKSVLSNLKIKTVCIEINQTDDEKIERIISRFQNLGFREITFDETEANTDNKFFVRD